ncbi:MAG: hypothetical protein ACI4HM_05190 [Ruminococcus sp.]
MLKVPNTSFLWLVECYNTKDSEFVSTDTESELVRYINDCKHEKTVISVYQVCLDGTVKKYDYKNHILYKMLTKDNKEVNRKKEYY